MDGSPRVGGWRPTYDFIVCGAGSSGLVVARRLAENADARVLLLEAGGTDRHPDVVEAARWRNNLGSERDWGFRTAPNPGLDGRPIPLSMGRVLGGGSSINVMGWARGHRRDWDDFAAASGEPSWSYDGVLPVYRRIEHFVRDGDRCPGDGEGLRIHPAEPGEMTASLLAAVRDVGLPTFERLNGALWESDVGGASLWERRSEGGRRLSLYRDYIAPVEGRDNLDVLVHARVRRVVIEGDRAVGVAFTAEGRTHEVRADREVVLSLGAVNTPCVLLRSGVGDAADLRGAGVDVVHDLPGVGRGLQDHLLLPGLVWERVDPASKLPDAIIAEIFAASGEAASPNIKLTQIDGARPVPGQALPPGVENALTLIPGLVRPKSSGRVGIAGPDPDADPVIEPRYLEERGDMDALLAAVELARRLASSEALRGFVGRELFTEGLRGKELEAFVRQNASTYWHPSCSARMGCDGEAVVDGRLRVHGLDGLRIADASVLPHITISLTMGPCVIVGEKAASFIGEAHGL